MDQYAITAERMLLAQEDAAESACTAAAAEAGVDANAAAECDDGACACPNCPWRSTSGNWRAAA